MKLSRRLRALEKLMDNVRLDRKFWEEIYCSELVMVGKNKASVGCYQKIKEQNDLLDDLCIQYEFLAKAI